MFFYIYSLCTYQNRECVNSSSGSDPFGNNSYCCCLFFTMCVQISMDSNNLKLKALSLNVQGIHTFEKRKSLFIWLTKQNSDICFQQETYSTEEIENQWKKQWFGDIYFAHGSNLSHWVAILIQKSFDFKLKSF